jgi:hypothetical protein
LFRRLTDRIAIGGQLLILPLGRNVRKNTIWDLIIKGDIEILNTRGYYIQGKIENTGTNNYESKEGSIVRQ